MSSRGHGGATCVCLGVGVCVCLVARCLCVFLGACTCEGERMGIHTQMPAASQLSRQRLVVL